MSMECTLSPEIAVLSFTRSLSFFDKPIAVRSDSPAEKELMPCKLSREPAGQSQKKQTSLSYGVVFERVNCRTLSDTSRHFDFRLDSTGPAKCLSYLQMLVNPLLEPPNNIATFV